MNCPNCGSNVNPGENFCRGCGTKIVNNNFSQNQGLNVQNNMAQNLNVQNNLNNSNSNLNYVQNYNNQINQSNDINQINNDDDLIDAFIGQNVEALKKGGFCFNTLFFGVIYVFYRKMWLLGIIWLVINVIVDMFLPTYSSLITLAANIIISIKFKEWYLNHVKEKVEEIKNENPGKSRNELKDICQKKGGVSVLTVIIIVIIYVLLYVIAIYSSFNLYNTTRKSMNNDSLSSGNLKYQIPDIMKLSDYSTDNFKIYTAISTEYNYYCSLSLSSHNSFKKTAKQYLEEHILYSVSDKFSGISTKKINGVNWEYATVTKESGIVYYYYSFENDGTMYYAEYDIIYDKGNVCLNSYNIFINSLKFG